MPSGTGVFHNASTNSFERGFVAARAGHGVYRHQSLRVPVIQLFAIQRELASIIRHPF